jgi:phosphopantothenoylcysteine synthetase/decarboxylase
VVVLGVTGSIAAYKAAELVRLMTSRGWDVSVVMTQDSLRFVGEITFRTLSMNPVVVDMFDRPDDWVPGHVSLADRADAVVVAPCTANVLAKMAAGIADDALTCVLLATVAPVLVAPAMNDGMWVNPATRANVSVLRKRGVDVLGVGHGALACGRNGAGRMIEPAAILEAVVRRIAKRKARRT